MGGKWKKLAFGLGALLCSGLLVSLAWSFFGFNLNLKGDPSVKAPATQAIMSASLDANQLVQRGRDLLAAHDLVGAAQAFHDAVVADPSNQTANFFDAGMRLINLYEAQQDGPDPATLDSIKEFMDAFGVQGNRDIYHFSAHLAKDATGHNIVPPNLPRPPAYFNYLLTVFMPELNGALANLDATNQDFTAALMPAETTASYGVLIDHGDIEMFKSALYLTKAAILFSAAYNTDVDPNALYDKQVATHFLSYKTDILDPNPDLLTPVNPSLLPQAKAALHASIAAYMEGSNYIRNIRPADRRGNLVILEPGEEQEEADVRMTLVDLDAALDAPGYVRARSPKAEMLDLYTNLPALFDSANPTNIRSILPEFDPATNKVIPGSFPDQTLGGVLNTLLVNFRGKSEGFIVTPGMADGIRLYVRDGLGNFVHGASVRLDFSNGDPSINLYDDGAHGDDMADDGIYGGTWEPSHLGPCTITATAAKGGYQDAHAWVTGTVSDTLAGSSYDECSNAYAISALPFSTVADISTATENWSDPTNECNWDIVYQSVWFKYTATSSGYIRATVSATNNDFMPVCGIYTGSCGSFTSLGCTGGYGGSGTSTLLPVTKDVTYYFQVGSSWGGGTSVNLRVEQVSDTPPPLASFSFQRASIDSSGNESNGYSYMPGEGLGIGSPVSADGRYIVFLSNATNLVSGVTDGNYHVYVRDTVGYATALVDVSTGGVQGNGNVNGSASVSGDGRYVAFDSAADNLVDNDTNGASDIFVRDTAGHTTERISVGLDAAESDGYSAMPAISTDGRYVMFYSYATNLVPGDTNNSYDLFVYDRQEHTTSLVSVKPDGTQFGSNCDLIPPYFSISADGSYALFAYIDYDTGDSLYFKRDLKLGVTVQVTDQTAFINDPAWPNVSDDGRFRLEYTPVNWEMGISIVDRFTGQKLLVPGVQMYNYVAAISGDGTRIIFDSYQDNLVPGDTNYNPDVFFTSNPLYYSAPAKLLTTSVSPAGTGWVTLTPSSANNFYAKDSTVTAIAVPWPGYSFTGWSGDAAGTTNPLSVTMNANKSLTANFTYTDTDTTPPTSSITYPSDGAMLSAVDGNFLITGRADDWPGIGVKSVDVSTDGGATWHTALDTSVNGTWATWSYSWKCSENGLYSIKCRATDKSDNLETPGKGVSVVVVFGGIMRASVASDGTQANSDSNAPSISADGRYIAFQSYAWDLVPGDTNGYPDIFVHDRQTGTTERVSVASDGSELMNTYCWSPSISGDGRYVAYTTQYFNQVQWTWNYDVFVHDLQTGMTERVSVAYDGSQFTNTSYGSPSISADGRYVAYSAQYYSYADSMWHYDVFVYDQQTGETKLVSLAPDGSQFTNSVYGVIGLDGSYVLLSAYDSATGMQLGYKRNLQTSVTEQITDMNVFFNDPAWRKTSADGRFGLASKDEINVAVVDNSTGVTTPVITTGGGYTMSADGRFIAFDSDAGSLVPNDTNGTWDVFYVANPLFGAYTKLSVIAAPGSGGSVTVEPANANGLYYKGSSVTITATPSSACSEFTGWSGDASGTDNPLTVVMDTDKTVTANFAGKKYHLTTGVNDALGGTITPASGDYDCGAQLQVKATANAGYVFAGWNGTPGGSDQIDITMNGDMNIRADFAAKQTLTVTPSGSGTVTISPDHTGAGDYYLHGDPVTLTAVPSSSCYEFTGWSGDAAGTTNPLTLTVNSNMAVTANFGLRKYHLTTSVNDALGGSITPASGDYDCGAQLQVKATPNSGYVFAGWNGTPGGSDQMDITMNGDMNIRADFTAKRALVVSPVGSGTVTISPDKTGAGQYYLQGDEVTLTAVPSSSCYEFTGWSGDATGTTNPLHITMNSDKTISANFAVKRYHLATAVNDSAMGSVTPASGDYDCGSSVELQATANPGFVFTGWSGDATGTAPFTVVMDSSKTVTANFTPVSGPYVTGINPNTGVLGTTITISGYNFGTVKGVVYIGTVKAPISTWAGSSITVVSPKGLSWGSYDVYVVTKDLKNSNKVSYQVMRPAISGASATNGTVGDTAILTGTYFGSNPSVVFVDPVSQRSVKAKVTASSDTSITLVVPRLVSGHYSICVVNSQGQSEGYGFDVELPVITGLSVSSGKYLDSITLAGNHFGPKPKVSFIPDGGEKGPAAKVVSHSDTSIMVQVPKAVAGSYNIKVKNIVGPSNGKPFKIN